MDDGDSIYLRTSIESLRDSVASEGVFLAAGASSGEAVIVGPVGEADDVFDEDCSCAARVTEEGSPFSANISALALYLRFTHAVSYKRLCQLFEHLFALHISEGALDALFQKAKLRFDDKVAAVLARLRKARVIYSDETSVRIDGKTCWNWVFQNKGVVTR